MRDRFGRTINYLRVSVTDRCNLRCVYCMPETGVAPIPRERVLSYEEIAAFVKVAAALGVSKVRLTGGEPLVRRDVASLVRLLAAVSGVTDLSLTTNGILLASQARELREAGLRRVNVSLDAVEPAAYARLTRGGDVGQVLAGIAAAQAAGLAPIKLNCVVTDSPAEKDAREVAAYAGARGLEVRYIRRMDLAEGHFAPIEGGTGGRCGICNRLRLSSDGVLSPCLFSDIRVSLREYPAAEALRRCVEAKPECGTASRTHHMHEIGG